MKRLLILVLAMISFSTPASAGACYSQYEAEAEQGIRIHSELMVIGLNCQHMGKRHGDNLYMTYRQFTADYADLFSSYESALLAYFQKNGDKNPEATLNTLRTNFANKISDDAAKMRPDVFCSTYAPRIEKAAQMNEQQLRSWAGTIYPSHPVSRPVCSG